MKARPKVMANFALTWDARTTTRNRTPSDFSSPRDKRRLLEIRAMGDAVLASARTVAADRMTMGMPDAELRVAREARGQASCPLRVLITNSGLIDSAMPLFEKNFSPIAIFSTVQMPDPIRETLAPKADLWLHDAPAVNLPGMMATLRKEYGVKRLVCEGGAQLFRSLLEADLVDEIFTTLCPRVFGGAKAPTLTGVAGDFLTKSKALSLREMDIVDGECFLHYRLAR